jgi:hypothetical protein
MSINMDSDGPVDYSDFEYQQFAIEHESASPQFLSGNTDDTAEINTQAYFEFDPLQTKGGLGAGEVAELVYAEIQASVEPEDDSGEQTDASVAEFRGVFGSDLAPSQETLLLNLTQNIEAQSVGTQQGGNINIDTDETGNVAPFSPGETQSRDNIFQMFQSYCALPSDEGSLAESASSASGGSHETQLYTKNWRELTGRGPVLDSSDSLSAVTRVVAGNSVLSVTGVLRGHLVWDISTVEDVDDRFSVPSDD